MEPIWGRQDPDGSHVGPMNFAVWEYLERTPAISGRSFSNLVNDWKKININLKIGIQAIPGEIIVSWWRHTTMQICLYTYPGNGLLPDHNHFNKIVIKQLFSFKKLHLKCRREMVAVLFKPQHQYVSSLMISRRVSNDVLSNSTWHEYFYKSNLSDRRLRDFVITPLPLND